MNSVRRMMLEMFGVAAILGTELFEHFAVVTFDSFREFEARRR